MRSSLTERMTPLFSLQVIPMRKRHICTLMLSLTLACGHASAASTAELVVDGRIVPSACTMTLSRSTVDLGNIQSHRLNAGEPTALAPSSVTLGVACQAAARYALSITDDRASSVAPGVAGVAHPGASDSEAFGLGTTSRGSIGAYVLGVSDGMADGASATMVRSSDGGATWTDTSVLAPGQLFTGWRGPAGEPAELRNSTIAIAIKPAVVGTDQLDLSAAVELDGRAVIELVYL